MIRNHTYTQARAAFTLIELLCVIAIIAILASILFPVFAQAKASAKTAVCLSNQKQVAISSLMYATDYDDTFPISSAIAPNANPSVTTRAYWWYSFTQQNAFPFATLSFGADGGLLNPYLKSFQVQGCPQADIITPIDAINPNAGPILAISQNTNVCNQNLSKIDSTAATVLTCDGGLLAGNNEVKPNPSGMSAPVVSGFNLAPSTHARHPGVKANVSWCDGHAKLTSVAPLDVATVFPTFNYTKAGFGWIVPPGVNQMADPLAACYYLAAKLAGCPK